jgi:hypothetical protein
MSRRRIITHAIIFLLLVGGGAIVNVAVAWGCSQWAGRSIGPVRHLTDQAELRSWWYRFCPIALPAEPDFSYVESAPFLSQSVAYGFAPRGLDAWVLMLPVRGDHQTLRVRGHRMRAGWPVLALEGQYWSDETNSAVAKPERQYRWAVHRSLNWPDVGGDEWAFAIGERMLPLRPIWPGFAINTVFYAAVLWMLFALGGTPFALRKWRRIRRGLCPKCGYDLRNRPSDSAACPECGAPSKVR